MTMAYEVLSLVLFLLAISGRCAAGNDQGTLDNMYCTQSVWSLASIQGNLNVGFTLILCVSSHILQNTMHVDYTDRSTGVISVRWLNTDGYFYDSCIVYIGWVRKIILRNNELLNLCWTLLPYGNVVCTGGHQLTVSNVSSTSALLHWKRTREDLVDFKVSCSP